MRLPVHIAYLLVVYSTQQVTIKYCTILLSPKEIGSILFYEMDIWIREAKFMIHLVLLSSLLSNSNGLLSQLVHQPLTLNPRPIPQYGHHQKIPHSKFASHIVQ